MNTSPVCCPRCGAPSHVLEMHEDINNTVRRHRECDNLHRFLTYEVHGSALMPNHGSLRRYANTIRRRVEQWRRDQHIALAFAAFGWKHAAQTWGLSRSGVYYAVGRARRHAVRPSGVHTHALNMEGQEDSPGA